MRKLLLLGIAMNVLAADETDWRAESARRIEAHRKADFSLRVETADGRPAAGVAVEARLVRHAFLFGTCVNTDLLRAQTENGAKYRQILLEHFSGLVDENSMKWYAIEKERGQIDFSGADAILAFAAEHGLPLRGHCLHWSKQKFAKPWVQALAVGDLRDAMLAQIDRTVAHAKGKVVAWDVFNELLDGDYFQKRLGTNITAEVFQRAAASDPEVPLFVNEYHIIDSDERVETYLALIADLKAQGAKIDGIGVQEHAAERFAAAPKTDVAEDKPERASPGSLDPWAVWRRLDRLASTGLPIHLTEISAKTESGTHRADALEIFMRTAFAHPDVEAILLWGFWEKSHWLGAPAALVSKDWETLEAGQRVFDLWGKEWTTRVTLTTDAGGKVAFRGFPGRYEVSAQGVTRVITLDAANPSQTLR
jgi:endo-1,4-beta-xylanase